MSDLAKALRNASCRTYTELAAAVRKIVADDLVREMAALSAGAEREIELIVRPDGTATMMAAHPSDPAGAPACAFEEMLRFESMAEVWLFFQVWRDLGEDSSDISPTTSEVDEAGEATAPPQPPEASL